MTLIFSVWYLVGTFWQKKPEGSLDIWKLKVPKSPWQSGVGWELNLLFNLVAGTQIRELLPMPARMHIKRRLVSRVKAQSF